MVKWIKRLSVLTVIVVSGGWLILHFITPYALLKPQRWSGEGRWGRMAQIEPTEQLTWKSADGLTLSASRFAVDQSRGQFVILHGISSNKETQKPLAQWLNSRGYDAITVDLRAHGKSEGEYCTFGFHEKEDISRLVDILPDEPTFVWGSSLGGAVALQALEHDERLDGGVIVSTFSTLNEIALDYQRRTTKIGWSWIRDYTLKRGAEIAGIDPMAVSPEASCRSIDDPVFIIHGTNDRMISVDYARRNFDALASPQKELVIIDGAGHNNAWHRGGDELKSKVDLFFQKDLAQRISH